MWFRTRRGGGLGKGSGFTLIEILVVITVIAILASLVTPMVFRNVGDAKIVYRAGPDRDLRARARHLPARQRLLPVHLPGSRGSPNSPAGEPAARNWRGPYLKKAYRSIPMGAPTSIAVRGKQTRARTTC